MPVQKRTLVSQIYEYLRGCIVNLSLKPGEKIDVKQLAQKFSVSQTPIREALHKLTEQGLVVSKPYVGYFVVRLTPVDIEELFDLRKALEMLALKYVFDSVDEELLRELRRRVNELTLKKRLDAILEETRKLDEDLHLNLLIRGTNNKWLTKVANGVIDLIKLTTRLSVNPEAAHEEHREILEAIAERDLRRAAAALEAHLERAKRDSIEAWQNQQAGDSSEEGMT